MILTNWENLEDLLKNPQKKFEKINFFIVEPFLLFKKNAFF